MTPEKFAYWLNGFVELNKGQKPTDEQWEAIRLKLEKAFRESPFRIV
ncbi:hypothetical protein VPH49_24335 [Pseudomonas luteola]